jgi:hypothetical protein
MLGTQFLTNLKTLANSFFGLIMWLLSHSWVAMLTGFGECPCLMGNSEGGGHSETWISIA